MSDFFSDIYSKIQPPDSVINGGGALPSQNMSNMPVGFDGTPDGRINEASSLLGNLNPYAYGKGDRLSTQTAYLNIPHVAQRIVPQINIPESQPYSAGGRFFGLNHQVDDGDIAFVIRAMFSPFEIVQDKKKYSRQGVLFAIDPIVNLATVNYLLHGLQRYGFNAKNERNWNTLWTALGIDTYFKTLDGETSLLSTRMQEMQSQLNQLSNLAVRDTEKVAERLSYIVQMKYHRRRIAEYIIKHVITPFGVPKGSEKQGGQHQGIVNKAVTWPVDFVTSMVIDGKVINLVNFWKHEDINAGDDLMLYLEDRSHSEYVLSHHPKSRKTQRFPELGKWEVPACLVDCDKIHNDASVLFQRIWDLMSHVEAQPNAPGVDHTLLQSNLGVSSSYNRPTPATNSRYRADWGSTDGGNVFKSEALLEISIALKNTDAAGIQAWLLNVGNAFKMHGKGRIVQTMRNLNSCLRETDRKGSKKMDYTPKLVNESIFQLVPGVFSSRRNAVREAIWQHGYWHIARCQVMQFKYDLDLNIENASHNAGGAHGKLIEATFAPVWTQGLEADSITGSAGNAASFAVDANDSIGNPFTKRSTKVSALAITTAAMQALLKEINVIIANTAWISLTDNIPMRNYPRSEAYRLEKAKFADGSYEGEMYKTLRIKFQAMVLEYNRLNALKVQYVADKVQLDMIVVPNPSALQVQKDIANKEHAAMLVAMTALNVPFRNASTRIFQCLADENCIAARIPKVIAPSVPRTNDIMIKLAASMGTLPLILQHYRRSTADIATAAGVVYSDNVHVQWCNHEVLQLIISSMRPLPIDVFRGTDAVEFDTVLNTLVDTFITTHPRGILENPIGRISMVARVGFFFSEKDLSAAGLHVLSRGDTWTMPMTMMVESMRKAMTERILNDTALPDNAVFLATSGAELDESRAVRSLYDAAALMVNAEMSDITLPVNKRGDEMNTILSAYEMIQTLQYLPDAKATTTFAEIPGMDTAYYVKAVHKYTLDKTLDLFIKNRHRYPEADINKTYKLFSFVYTAIYCRVLFIINPRYTRPFTPGVADITRFEGDYRVNRDIYQEIFDYVTGYYMRRVGKDDDEWKAQIYKNTEDIRTLVGPVAYANRQGDGLTIFDQLTNANISSINDLYDYVRGFRPVAGDPLAGEAGILSIEMTGGDNMIAPTGGNLTGYDMITPTGGNLTGYGDTVMAGDSNRSHTTTADTTGIPKKKKKSVFSGITASDDNTVGGGSMDVDDDVPAQKRNFKKVSATSL
jgi:hypothetical protein